jgi:Pyruvate/2-oxoacid:ferredoxin oxidoreductase delta subunit
VAYKDKKTRNRYMRMYTRQHRKRKGRPNERWYNLKRLYGITRAEYEALLAAQDGKCAICGRASKKPLAVDHNHVTRQVRGLLCQGCNIAVGVCEKEGIAERAIAYLVHHAKPNLKVV